MKKRQRKGCRELLWLLGARHGNVRGKPGKQRRGSAVTFWLALKGTGRKEMRLVRGGEGGEHHLWKTVVEEETRERPGKEKPSFHQPFREGGRIKKKKKN